MNPRNATLWFLAILIVIVLGFTLAITLPFLRPVAFAIILAVIFYPVHEWVLRLTHGKRTLSCFLTTLGVIFLFGVPVALILLKATSEAVTAAQYLTRRSAEQGGFTLFIMTMVDRPLQLISRVVDVSKYNLHQVITDNLQKAGVVVLSSGAAILGNFARLIADLFITLIVLLFLFRDGRDWAIRLGTMMPLSPAQVHRLYSNISDTIVANVYGIVSVGFAQGVLTGIAVALVGLPSPLLLGVAAFLASVIPVVGAALVWVPAGLYLIFTGALWKGIFVLVWGTVVISTCDNFIRPWVVSGKVELHPLVLLFFILGGVQAFGFLGLFLGPVIASVLSALFSIFREEMAASSAEARSLST